jgi:hypothetical protein
MTLLKLPLNAGAEYDVVIIDELRTLRIIDDRRIVENK